jgi:hypothetical protein
VPPAIACSLRILSSSGGWGLNMAIRSLNQYAEAYMTRARPRKAYMLSSAVK